MNRIYLLILIFPFLFSCSTQPKFSQGTINRAIENGIQANEGYVRGLKFTEAWLTNTNNIATEHPNIIQEINRIFKETRTETRGFPYGGVIQKRKKLGLSTLFQSLFVLFSTQKKNIFTYSRYIFVVSNK